MRPCFTACIAACTHPPFRRKPNVEMVFRRNDSTAHRPHSHASMPLCPASSRCEPNVEVVFRRNDSTAAFVAARDIDKVGRPV